MAPDADLLREMIGFAAQRLMELEVESQTGSAYGEKNPERPAQRNGYRDRIWERPAPARSNCASPSCAKAPTSPASWTPPHGDVEGRELARIDHDGEQRFRLPNDLCFGKDGHLYLTDSGIAAQDFLAGQNFAENYRKLPWDGRVYEIDAVKGSVLRILDRGVLFTNGIAFGPDDALYANASFTGEVYRYDVFWAAKPRREVFGNVLQPFQYDDFRGPDGMCWRDDGRLYCTVYGHGSE